jgi:hypothetical protein
VGNEFSVVLIHHLFCFMNDECILVADTVPCYISRRKDFRSIHCRKVYLSISSRMEGDWAKKLLQVDIDSLF